MRCMIKVRAFTPSATSHREIIEPATCLSWSRYHFSTMACRSARVAPSPTDRISVRWLSSTVGGAVRSMTFSSTRSPQTRWLSRSTYSRAGSLGCAKSLRWLLLIQRIREMAKTRIASSSSDNGAAMRMRPVGGCTLRCRFLMSFRRTSTVRSPRLITCTINTPVDGI